jgi:protein phosphatase
VITRAIGVFRDVEVDMVELPWVERDIYLLCSDGLSDFVPLDEIKGIVLSGEHDLEALNDALIQSALDQGGHDNVTVVLVQLGKVKSKFKALKGTLGKILGNRPDS